MYSSVSKKYRKGTRFVISFPTLPSLKAVPRVVELYQEPYKHDILVLNYPKFSSVWYKSLKTGTPITFKWTQGTVSKTWTGYVSHVSKMAISQRETPMEITCIGASFVLKEKSQAVFKNKTIPEVAALIAKKHKLNFVGDKHPRRFAHISISGQSYWQWLQENAKKIGFVMYVDGINLVFKSFDKVLDSQSKALPIFSLTDTVLPMNSQFLDRTLDSLKVINGDYVEGLEFTRDAQTASGVDPVTGKVLKAQKNPRTSGKSLRTSPKAVLFNNYNVTKVVNDFIAVETAAAGAAEMARFTVPAKAVGQGDPRVHPYSSIIVNGTGEGSDGHWIVLKARHTLHRVGDYTLEMALATDGTGTVADWAFRPRDMATANVINIDSLLRDTTTTNASNIVAVLPKKEPVLYEGEIGYASTPLHWEHKRYSDVGCCG
jgi:phage protein D